MTGEDRVRIVNAALAAAVAVLLLNPPAQAQKARDRLRVATTGQTNSTVSVENPQPETDLVNQAVYDGLACYDMKTASFSPLLARSWTQIDDLTTEFALRDDVVWQDGSRFTADDVVYTLHYLVDPASKLRFAPENFSWLARVEKIDDYRVRLIAKRIDPLALLNLANVGNMLPAKLHSSYADKQEFGRLRPVGTGPYKVVAIDPGKHVTLARNPDYRHGNDCKPAATIGAIEIAAIPDAQTRMAQLITGGLEILRAETRDQTELFAGNPDFTVTVAEGAGFAYLTMDALGRAGNAALTQQKVRQAIVQAIDRATVVHHVMAGGEAVRLTDALCAPLTRDCGVAAKPYPYDPAAARRLLADSGYPDGLDVEIAAAGGMATLAEALSGELRKVGIRAKITALTAAAYIQQAAAGRIQLGASSFGLPDVASNVELFFDGTPKDSWRDPLIAPLVEAGRATLDHARRRAIYAEIHDRMNREAYILPIASNPGVFVHAKDLAIPGDSNNKWNLELYKLTWR
jgi:peptide/nickel transport system substrate-binding protein